MAGSIGLYNLQEELTTLDIDEVYKDIISELIAHFHAANIGTLTPVIDTLERTISVDENFIASEEREGLGDDEYLGRVRERVRKLKDIKAQIESVKEEWNF